MNFRVSKYLLLALFAFCAKFAVAEEYPSIVMLEGATDRIATFTSVGIADKKNDAEMNAVRSLFYTLFYMGVDGVNNGQPLISNKNESYERNFIANKSEIYAANREVIKAPSKTPSKSFQTTVKISVPMQNLYKELIMNGVYGGSGVMASTPSASAVNGPSIGAASNVLGVSGNALPSIIVVPAKTGKQSYEEILNSDYDRRIAVSKLQEQFDKEGINTIDLPMKIEAMKRRGEYEAMSADSNDKQLLLNSGAEVYVTVDVQKLTSSEGSRVSLIMKAYDTASGEILGTTNGTTRSYKTSRIEDLCAYAVADYSKPLLSSVIKEFNSRALVGRKVVLQISIDGNSMMTMDDEVDGDPLSDVILQWVRRNAEGGDFRLQGIVPESMIFDYIMIPLKDSDGLAMDATQFAYVLRRYLIDKGVDCSRRVDGSTIYLEIE